MPVNRLSLFALYISIGFHAAILSAAGGYFAHSGKQITKLEIQAIEPQIEKNPYLPEIKVIGEFKQLGSVDSQPSKVHGQKDDITRDEDKSFQKTKIKKLSTVGYGPLPAKQKFITADEAQQAMLRYQDAVKQRIESCRRYPAWAQKQKIEGAVDLQFTIVANGSSQNIAVVQGSGSSLLDQEALDTIKRASPFRPLPREINQEVVNIRVAIVFSMR